jgi:hypothetical protein
MQLFRLLLMLLTAQWAVEVHLALVTLATV